MLSYRPIVSDTFGVSASRMIKAIMSGNFDTDSLAELAVGRLKGKKRETQGSPAGAFSRSSWFMIQASLEKIITDLDRQINEKLKDYHRERELLASIPA